jgi:hypothetical protein
MSISSTTALTRSVKPKTIKLIIAVTIVVIILASVGAYVLTPPLTVSVTGFVRVAGAYEIIFGTGSSFYSVAVDSVGSYSISLPNQHAYDVSVHWIFRYTPTSSPIPQAYYCGTLSLYQSTKLGSWEYNILDTRCTGWMNTS